MIAAIAASGLIGLLINLVIAGLIFWILWWAVNFINPPEPFKKVIVVILVLLACLYLINLLLGLSGNAFVTF